MWFREFCSMVCLAYLRMRGVSGEDALTHVQVLLDGYDRELRRGRRATEKAIRRSIQSGDGYGAATLLTEAFRAGGEVLDRRLAREYLGMDDGETREDTSQLIAERVNRFLEDTHSVMRVSGMDVYARFDAVLDRYRSLDFKAIVDLVGRRAWR